MTDTADYADIVLPATTQLEHDDVHKSYGHLYVLANNAAIAPVGESLPNIEVFRRLAARMGFDDACFRDSDDDVARQALGSGHRNLAGIDWEELKRARLAAARGGRALRAVRRGRLPDAVRQVRAAQRGAGEAGHRPAAVLQPARRVALEQPAAGGEIPAQLPVAAAAQLPQLELRQPAALSRGRQGARGRAAPRGRGGARPARRRPRCACSTTAARSARWRASTASRAAAWWSRCRCGGRSSRPTAGTRTTSPRSAPPTSAAPRPSTIAWSRSRRA